MNKNARCAGPPSFSLGIPKPRELQQLRALSAPSAPTPIQRHKAWPRLPVEKKFHVPYPYWTSRRAETRTSIDHTQGS